MDYRNVEEAELARIDLVERIQQIDAQLTEYGSEQHKEPGWRTRAVRARAMLNSKLMRTNLYLRSNRSKESSNAQA